MTKRTWEPEVEVTPEFAKSLIEDQFAQLAPVSIKKIGQGWDNVAYEVNGTYIFRFPQRVYSAGLIETEIRALPIIARLLPTPISAPDWVGKANTRYPWLFAGYKKIVGTPGNSVEIPANAQSQFARALGKFLHELHTIDSSVSQRVRLTTDQHWRLNHARQYAYAKEMFSRLETAGVVQNTRRFLNILSEIAADEESIDPVIVHGDFSSGHVIVGDNYSLAGVIDWGDIFFGHPANDLTIAYELFTPERRYEFFNAYGKISDRTLELTRYRAICAAAIAGEYAYSIGDKNLLRISLQKLENTLV